MNERNPVVDLIGKESFLWLSSQFTKETLLSEVPDGILAAIAEVDVATRNFGADRGAVTAIALITFAYQLAQRSQQAHLGPRDMLLTKILAKEELKRRNGQGSALSIPKGLSLFEIITGEVGERIRSMVTINSPFQRGT